MFLNKVMVIFKIIMSLNSWFINVLGLVYILLMWLSMMVGLLYLLYLGVVKALQSFCEYPVLTLIYVRVRWALLIILVSFSLFKVGNSDTLVDRLSMKS